MARARRASAARAASRALLRFGPPLAGPLVLGHAVVISVGGIGRRRFALGVPRPLAGFAATLVPER